MKRHELAELIRKKRSFLCVGLDTDEERIPASLRKGCDDPVFAFNKRIIDATIDYAVAYKPNVAFYEARGSQGWNDLEKTIDYLVHHPGGPVLTIADAKRGDIGNSAQQYARAFFDRMSFDAVTVNPYMGRDAIVPFLTYPGKWAVVLGLTSNPGSADFQQRQPQAPLLLEKLGIKMPAFRKLYQVVIEESMHWGNAENMMFVVGATHPELLAAIRKMIPDHFLLIPGVGHQGGELDVVAHNTLNDEAGILVNSARSIIYASGGNDFAESAHEAAQSMQRRMEQILSG